MSGGPGWRSAVWLALIDERTRDQADAEARAWDRGIRAGISALMILVTLFLYVLLCMLLGDIILGRHTLGTALGLALIPGLPLLAVWVYRRVTADPA